MQQSVPLNKLVLSSRNVRKTNGDEDIAGLAESIDQIGLLKNLVVSPAEAGKGVFEVDAGGRRLRALQLLAERKALPKNWPVPVKVIERALAREASLAENKHRVAMNPADEVEAFADIVAQYELDCGNQALAIANCAKRYGHSERHIRQRLALAALAPKILDALRDGRINLAAASAYAAHPNQAEQLAVFTSHEKRTGEYGKHDPRTIRDTLKGRLYSADHKLVRFVGLDAYRAAGGQSALDLFFEAEDEDREVLLDTALLEKLATEKGAREAQVLAQGEGWLDGLLKPVTGHSWVYPPEPAGYVRRYQAPEQLSREARLESVAIYGLGDSAELELDTYYVFVKVQPAQPSEGGGYKPETAEEREARLRQAAIYVKAFKLAAPPAAGTPFEGKLFFDAGFDSWDIAEDEDDETMLVASVTLRIPKAEVDAQMAEAERRYELEQQELREEDEALAAEIEGDGPEPAPAEAGDGEAGDEADLDPNVNDAAAEPEPA